MAVALYHESRYGFVTGWQKTRPEWAFRPDLSGFLMAWNYASIAATMPKTIIL
jgi:hypothetical protein